MAESSAAYLTDGGQGGGIPESDGLTNAIIGIWLFILYLVTIIVTILMLSSYQIQSRMQYVEISGSRVSIWRLNELSDAYNINKKDLESRQYSLRLKEDDLAGIRARIRELDKQYTPVFVKYYADIRIFMNDYEALNKGFEFDELDKHRSSVKILYDHVARQIDESKLNDDLSKRFDDLTRRHESGDDIFRNISSAKNNASRVTVEIENFRANLETRADRVKQV